MLPDTTTVTLKQFVQATVSPGMAVISDGLRSYPPALGQYGHYSINISATGLPVHESLPVVHRVFSLVQPKIESTYQGAGTEEHLQDVS